MTYVGLCVSDLCQTPSMFYMDRYDITFRCRVETEQTDPVS